MKSASESDSVIAARAFAHLQAVVAIESASDEDSASVPSTPGQARLADHVGAFFAGLGASVERDAHANVIATLPGRGSLRSAPPLALMVHLDTAKGTRPEAALTVTRAWDGERLPFADNPQIRVDVATYPTLSAFLGHDIVHGGGRAPFGLDDKLGLTHLMTLAWLLAENPEIPHRPLLLIGRPDEEIGRTEALVGLAALLAERGVRRGFTVDGIEPYEVNVENFNGARASVTLPSRPVGVASLLVVHLAGVNTHGATAHAEGHRAAVRFAVEVVRAGGAPVVGFRTEPSRECDGLVVFDVSVDGAAARTMAALHAVTAPHRDRGAGWSERAVPSGFVPDGAAGAMLAFVDRFLASDPGFTLLAEESHGHDGYSHPFRAFPVEQGVQVDLRLRDFTVVGLAARMDHVARLGGYGVSLAEQYRNMGPRLADAPELVRWAQAAGAHWGHDVRVRPIRGGTGVDPFLDVGVAVGNLGTGYFAPESEKELTSLQMLAGHARWLLALVQLA